MKAQGNSAVRTALVTGGAGFIGSHLVGALCAGDWHVRVVDNLSTGHLQNLDGIKGVEFILGDVIDGSVASKAVEGVQVVFHLAALASVPGSVIDPLRSHRANVDGTLSILLAAREAGARRVIYAGSSSVYGDMAPVPVHEGASPNPQSPYALQKFVGEGYCRLLAGPQSFEAVVLRFFNVFGPRQDASSPDSGVVARFATAVLRDQRPTIYGDGRQKRDFVFIQDVVDAVLRAADAPGIDGEVINVGSGRSTSLCQVLEVMTTLVGRRIAPVFVQPRSGDPVDSQAHIGKAKTLLDYQPKVSLEEGLASTFAWYLPHDSKL